VKKNFFLDFLARPEFKPVVGEGDELMKRKVDVRWSFLLAEFQKANALLANSRATSVGLRLKTDFDIQMLQRKLQSFRDLCQQLKKECKVGRHQLAGETGAASEGQPTTAQQAIDNATKILPLFAYFHAAGEVQRLRDDTYKDRLLRSNRFRRLLAL
jgi:hypothetical protein